MKLRLRDRAQTAVLACESGLVKPGERWRSRVRPGRRGLDIPVCRASRDPRSSVASDNLASVARQPEIPTKTLERDAQTGESLRLRR